MTLNEAINKCNSEATRLEKLVEEHVANGRADWGIAKVQRDQAAVYRQLGEWLTDYKTLTGDSGDKDYQT